MANGLLFQNSASITIKALKGWIPDNYLGNDMTVIPAGFWPESRL